MIGEKPREAGEDHSITAAMSEEVWKTMISDHGIGADIEVMIHKQPVRFIYEFLENNTKTGDTLVGVYGSARGADGRFKGFKKYAPEGVSIKEMAVRTQSVEEGGASGTALRNLIYDDKREEFFTFMPDLSPQAQNKIWNTISRKEKIDLEEINNMVIEKLNFLKEAAIKVKINKDLEEVSSVGGAGTAFQGFSGNPPKKKLIRRKGF